MAKNKNTSKRKKKTRKQLLADAEQWLLDNGYSTEDAKAIADGHDMDCTIDKVTGRVHWDADLRDQRRIQRYRDSKAWLRDPEDEQ